MADSTVRLSAKRNRSGVCSNPEVHRAHDTCPGRLRRAKIDRPIDTAIQSELSLIYQVYGGNFISEADRETIGILCKEDIDKYNFDLEAYKEVDFKQAGKFVSFYTTVKRVNAIILDYALQGLLPLTLRQIFYQVIVRHKDCPNNDVSYRHLCEDLVDARMAGKVPWKAIDDPSRDVHDLTAWDNASDRLTCAAGNHHLSRWANQDYAPIVLIEKDAALGTIYRACNEYDVPYTSCKGYGSITALRNKIAGHCRTALDHNKFPIVIHISDHDATGWDMPRNLSEKLNLFVGQHIDMRHIALNIDQITEGYGDGAPLPPDPVKDKDPRSKKYRQHLIEHGLEPGAWELDALPPAVLHNLIIAEVKDLIDEDQWKEVEAREQEQRAQLKQTADRWNDPLPCIGESA